ncbi:MAG: sodium:solute symporter [Alistipes sp.]|nr:sodium:solute symporter [Alistipes sp.]
MSKAIIIATILGYIAVLFTVAYYSGRKADNAGFFVGNRSSSWWMVMLAMVGAAMSGVTFVSVPGMVATSGFSYFQMALGFMTGYFVIAFLLIPLFYRMNLVSIYGYLEQRFGVSAYKTGAWFFFISKLLGASVRLFLICAVLQLLLFEPYGIPFWVNAAITVLLVLLYTFQGGVKSLIWTDTLKTVCLVLSIALSIWFVLRRLDMPLQEMIATVKNSQSSRIFFFDDINDRRYFFKQFLAGVFSVIAMTGLDQDMMQRSLACKNYKDSQKNLVVSSLLQTAIIFILLVLGVILYTFAERMGIALPAGSDNMFPTVATSPVMPTIVGVLFILGLVSSTYSAAGSALTALTTSFTIDVLGGAKRFDEQRLTAVRKRVHISMAVAMFAVICALWVVGNTNVIDAVYTLASYTYGPILGLFAFGIFTKWRVRGKFVGIAAVAAPAICFVLQQNSERWFGGYKFSYELLIVNALITFIFLMMLIKRDRR